MFRRVRRFGAASKHLLSSKESDRDKSSLCLGALRKLQLCLSRASGQICCIDGRLWIGTNSRVAQINVDLIDVALNAGLVEVGNETVPVFVRIC